MSGRDEQDEERTRRFYDAMKSLGVDSFDLGPPIQVFVPEEDAPMTPAARDYPRPQAASGGGMMDPLKSNSVLKAWWDYKTEVRFPDAQTEQFAKMAFFAGAVWTGSKVTQLKDKIFATAMREIDKKPTQQAGEWWCPRCNTTVQPEHVTYEETHDPRCGGCGAGVVIGGSQ